MLQGHNGKTSAPLSIDDQGRLFTRGNARGMVAITPNDNTIIDVTLGVYVGNSGDLAIILEDDSEVILKNIAEGMTHPLAVKCIKATGTTAAGIVAAY
jgi:hypothetical protein